MLIDKKSHQTVFKNQHQALKEEAQITITGEKKLVLCDVGENSSFYNLRIKLLKSARLDLKVFFLAQQKFTKEMTLEVEHCAPSATSLVSVHLVGRDTSMTKVFIKSTIHEHQHDSYAAQSTRGILLSPVAQVEATPQLLINNNDVQAKHEVKIGQIDASQLFYLQSKGIDHSTAVNLITQSYYTPFLEYLSDLQKNQLLGYFGTESRA